MANHGQKRTTEQMARHYAKPSRAKRHGLRWDARVKAMESYFAVRNAAHARALRIVGYLAARAGRRIAKAA
jgi:hypothetical protein